MTGKGALFYLFLERLIAVFANSTLTFSNRFIIVSRICIAVFIISIYIVIILEADGQYNPIMNQCTTTDGKWSKCMWSICFSNNPQFAENLDIICFVF